MFAELIQFWQDPKCRRPMKKKLSVLLEKDFIFRFHIYIYFENGFREWFSRMDFENGLLESVKNVTLRKVYNNFHDQLNKDIKSKRKSNNVFNFADKARNLYGTNKEN